MAPQASPLYAELTTLESGADSLCVSSSAYCDLAPPFNKQSRCPYVFRATGNDRGN
jgi:hypothetical protein